MIGKLLRDRRSDADPLLDVVSQGDPQRFGTRLQQPTYRKLPQLLHSLDPQMRKLGNLTTLR